MTRRFVRVALLALIGIVALAAAWQSVGSLVKVESQPTAHGHTAILTGTCKGNQSEGVTLIVEYDSKTFSACGLPAGKTGWDVLGEFGAKPLGTLQYPVGFVCKLFDFPTQEDCQTTPDAKLGTWNYFYATASQGNHWIYAVTGASIRKPKCGDVEGWVFEVPTSSESAEAPKTSPEPITCK